MQFRYYKEKLNYKSKNENKLDDKEEESVFFKQKYIEEEFETLYDNYVTSLINSNNNQSLISLSLLFQEIGRFQYLKYNYFEAHTFLKKAISLYDEANETTEQNKNFDKLLTLYAVNLQNLGYIEESEFTLRRALKSSIIYNSYKSLNTVESLVEYSFFYNFIEENKEAYVHLNKANKIINKVVKGSKWDKASVFDRFSGFRKNDNIIQLDINLNKFILFYVKVNYCQVLSSGQGGLKKYTVTKVDCDNILKDLGISQQDSINVVIEKLKTLIEVGENKDYSNIQYKSRIEKIKYDFIKSVSNYFSLKAYICQKDGNIKKSEILYKNSLDIILKIYGENDKHLTNIYSNLLSFYYQSNDDKNIKLYIEKIISLSKHLYGEIHIEYALNLMQIVKTIITYHYTDYTLNLLKQAELIMNARLQNLKDNENEKDDFISTHIYTAEINYLYGYLYGSIVNTSNTKEPVTTLDKSMNYLTNAITIYKNILGTTSESYFKAYSLKLDILENERLKKAKKEAHNQK